MELITETVGKKQTTLIIAKKNFEFLSLLKAELKKYDAEIYFSSLLPKNLSRFNYCFFINEPKISLSQIPFKKDQRLIFIFIKQQKQARLQLKSSRSNTKIISFSGNAIQKEQIDKILWFAFSQSKEKFLAIEAFDLKKPFSGLKKPRFSLPALPKKYFLIMILLLIVLFHFLFVPFLFFANYYCYQAFTALKKEDIAVTNSKVIASQQQLIWAKKLYQFVRPSYLLFSAAIVPDNILDLDNQTLDLINEAVALRQNSYELFQLVLKKDKTTAEKAQIDLLLLKINQSIEEMNSDLDALSQKLPSFPPLTTKLKLEIKKISDYLLKANKFLPYLGDVLAKNTQKKYLLMFANNRELRPGGGFIGSFGIVNFKDYTLEDLQIYDVYDADGQLSAHVEPPKAIREYLKQPHWFLRDSAFSPDFLENYAQAKFFLEKEMNQTNFSGAILLTTNTIENILEAFGEIYLPDFREKVNAHNFYLKAQTYSENNFVPGSLQKKSFLGSLSRQILLKIGDTSLKNLALEIKKSLDEKQLVVYIDQSDLQEVIDSFYWSGRLIQPRCLAQIDNCVVDFLFPIDANLGVNKANYYIYRSINLKTNIDQEGKINHVLDFQFKNESQNNVFPGGRYQNYFQVYLPQNTLIKKITKNNVLIEEYDEKNLDFKIVGFLLTVEPQQTVNLRLEYELEQTFKKGKGMYQLIVQKQIGSNNNDFGLNFSLAKNFYLLNQNFSPLVKDNQIVYNTNLVADKIFISELIKE